MDFSNKHLKVLCWTSLFSLLSIGFAVADNHGDYEHGELADGWLSYDMGNIIHGPGSYYLSDESITLRFPDIQSHEEAWQKIHELAAQDPTNPPVMWQLTDPWDQQPGHLVVH